MGPCIWVSEAEVTQQSGLGFLIPTLVGAGVDVLTNYLDTLAQDRQTKRTAVVLIEARPKCIQIARGAKTEEEVKTAPFALEFFVRFSHDGSAIALVPTMLRYQKALDGESDRDERSLYVTITIDVPGNATKTSTVTIPLGADIEPRRNYPFDPAISAKSETQGGPVSVWIPNPFATSSTTGSTAAPAQPAPAGGGVATPVDEEGAPAQLQAGTPSKTLAGAVAPRSMTVTFTEIRPGSAVAQFLSSIFKSAKPTIVSQVDPAARAAAEQTQLSAAQTNLTNWASARAQYETDRSAFCAAPDQAKLGAVYVSQVKLMVAATQAGQPALVAQQISPSDGLVAASARICAG
jgi:hypothetical protein